MRDELQGWFEHLHQGRMSVTEYEIEFTELSQYVEFLVPTETEKVRRFIEGLTYGIKVYMAREAEIRLHFIRFLR